MLYKVSNKRYLNPATYKGAGFFFPAARTMTAATFEGAIPFRSSFSMEETARSQRGYASEPAVLRRASVKPVPESPGMTAHTRMPYPLTSLRSASARELTAALLAE